MRLSWLPAYFMAEASESFRNRKSIAGGSENIRRRTVVARLRSFADDGISRLHLEIPGPVLGTR